jgi:hypothetical protein
MQMMYLPNAKIIIQDDGPRTVIATLGKLPPDGINPDTLAKAMAMAPALLCLLDRLAYVKPEPNGECHFTAEDMEPVRVAVSTFTEAETVDLTHYVHMVR